MKKNKQVHKTKEQLIADLKKNADFQAQIKFAREVFYPALCAASESVEDASMLLAGFNNQVMESFLGYMKTVKVSELKLDEKLDKESPKFKENQALLDLFKDQSVFEAKTHIEGMKGDIEKWKVDEMTSRPLSSLQTKWIDQL